METIYEKRVGRTGRTRRLVKLNDKYYVASYLPTAFDTGVSETLVFPADENGEITSWSEVAGGQRMSIDEALADLQTRVDNDSLVYTDEGVANMLAGWDEAGITPLEGFLKTFLNGIE